MPTGGEVSGEDGPVLLVDIRADGIELCDEGMFYPVHKNLRTNHHHNHRQHWLQVGCECECGVCVCVWVMGVCGVWVCVWDVGVCVRGCGYACMCAHYVCTLRVYVVCMLCVYMCVRVLCVCMCMCVCVCICVLCMSRTTAELGGFTNTLTWVPVQLGTIAHTHYHQKNDIVEPLTNIYTEQTKEGRLYKDPNKRV